MALEVLFFLPTWCAGGGVEVFLVTPTVSYFLVFTFCPNLVPPRVLEARFLLTNDGVTRRKRKNVSPKSKRVKNESRERERQRDKSSTQSLEYHSSVLRRPLSIIDHMGGGGEGGVCCKILQDLGRGCLKFSPYRGEDSCVPMSERFPIMACMSTVGTGMVPFDPCQGDCFETSSPKSGDYVFATPPPTTSAPS